MGKLETEIRKKMSVSEDEIAFTREGRYYWQNRNILSGIVKYVYIIFLGSLLLAFLTGKMIEDFKISYLLFAVDIIISISILIFYIAYSISSWSLDKSS